MGRLVAIDGGEVELSLAIDGEIALTDTLDGEIGTFMPLYPEAYTGSVVVTPSSETQTLNTANLMMPANVTVNPIPSNYGLITYNGSIITVS